MAHQYNEVISANQRFNMALCGLVVVSYDRQAHRVALRTEMLFSKHHKFYAEREEDAS
jgi:hypothetical protein